MKVLKPTKEKSSFTLIKGSCEQKDIGIISLWFCPDQFPTGVPKSLMFFEFSG